MSAQAEKERRQTRGKLGSDFTFEAMRGLQEYRKKCSTRSKTRR